MGKDLTAILTINIDGTQATVTVVIRSVSKPDLNKSFQVKGCIDDVEKHLEDNLEPTVTKLIEFHSNMKELQKEIEEEENKARRTLKEKQNKQKGDDKGSTKKPDPKPAAKSEVTSEPKRPSASLTPLPPAPVTPEEPNRMLDLGDL